MPLLPHAARWTIRALLIAAALAGLAVNIRYQRSLPALSREYVRLERLVGDLQIADPKQVWVLPLPNDTSEPLVWKWRLYLPAGYQPSVITASEEIAADSPRSRGGYSTGRDFGKNSHEFTASVAILKGHTGQWEIHTQRFGGRQRIGVSTELRELLDSGAFLIEAVDGSEATGFAADEPLCLLRLRSRTPSGTLDDGTAVFRGFYLYYVSEAAREDFEARRSGRKK